MASSAILALTLLAGCLVSGTFVIDLSIDNTDIMTMTEFQYFEVDLTQEEDWDDHKDQIDYIDNLGFQLWVTNNGASDVTGQLYMAEEYADSIDTAAEVEDEATLVLTGMTLSPGENYIDWPTSLGLIQNLDSVKTWVEGGEFVVYALTESLPFNITIDSATVIVTVTASE